MTRKEAEKKLEFIKTSAEERLHGLRRIKKRHYTGPPELLRRESASTELLEKVDMEKRRKEKLAA